MTFAGRSRELGAIRGALDRRIPSLVRVTGIRGGGKSSLVRHVLQDYPAILHVCPPLPDPDQRGALARRLRASIPDVGSRSGAAFEEGGEPGSDAPAPGDDASWAQLFEGVVRHAAAAERPFILVLDDAHRLAEARSRFARPLVEGLQKAAARNVPVHVVLVAHGGGLPDMEGALEGAAELDTVELPVGPLPFRSALPLLPGRTPAGKLRAYGVFGGIPGVLRQLDAEVTVGTNVRRLLLSSEGALAQAGQQWIEADLQAPSRYFAILDTLARGEADWSTIHEGVSDLTRSGQVAPYLKRLGELGLVEARRSVDAAPGGRSRRYALSDPFLAFWLRFILPFQLSGNLDEVPDGEGDHYARLIRPRIDEHMDSVFPSICRQHMVYDAIETLGAVAREGGSLWGPGYDLPVAGMLTNGAAYYGACRWRSPAESRSPLAEIVAVLREARYGFGRERRLRLVFTGRPPSMELRREVLRHPDAAIIDADALAGAGAE